MQLARGNDRQKRLNRLKTFLKSTVRNQRRRPNLASPFGDLSTKPVPTLLQTSCQARAGTSEDATVRYV